MREKKGRKDKQIYSTKNPTTQAIIGKDPLQELEHLIGENWGVIKEKPPKLLLPPGVIIENP